LSPDLDGFVIACQQASTAVVLRRGRMDGRMPRLSETNVDLARISDPSS
jgi:hypothetical protein